MERGRFITLEGGEGTGKSTQAQKIKEFLEQQEYEVILTREPGGSPGGEMIRELLVKGAINRWDPLSEYLLFSAARRDHLVHTIWPALEKGQWVISDRFYDSSRAYQGSGHGVDLTFISEVYHQIAGNFLPDLTLVFDLPPAGGLERTQNRTHTEDRFEQMGLAFHERARQAFLNMVQAEPHRCYLVNAADPIQEVTTKIYQHLEQKFFRNKRGSL